MKLSSIVALCVITVCYITLTEVDAAPLGNGLSQDVNALSSPLRPAGWWKDLREKEEFKKIVEELKKIWRQAKGQMKDALDQMKQAGRKLLGDIMEP